jgi:hypothetical protein
MIQYCVLSTSGKGDGVFSNQKIGKDELIGEYLTNISTKIGVMLKEGVWETKLGRYCNHSNQPNTYLKFDGRVYNIYSSTEIGIGDEIVTDYRMVATLLGFDETTYINQNFNNDILKNYGK